MAFKYVSGAPIKNAVGYKLHKTNNAGASLGVLETKSARQGFHNAGYITVSGTGNSTAQPTTTQKNITYGGTTQDFPSSVEIYPIKKYTGDGPKYYFKVSGGMDFILEDGSVAENVEFNGVYDELTSSDPITVGFIEGEPPIYEGDEDKDFYLRCKLTQNGITKNIAIKIFEPAGDAPVRVVRLTPNDQGMQIVSITAISDRYKHTDFIEIAALANSVLGPDNRLYCVGNLNKPGYDDICIMLFYSAMDYNKCVGSVTWGKVQEDYDTTIVDRKQYLTVDEIKEYAPKDANYVIFVSSSELENEDQVGVGIYFPLYGQYPDLKSGDYVAVEAVGDGFIYANSPLSEPKQYTE